MNIVNTIPREKVPVGMVVTYDGTTPPDGWISAEGQIISQGDYPILFAVIGTEFNKRYTVTNDKKWWQFWKPKTKIVMENMPGLFRLPDLSGLEPTDDDTQNS